MHYCVLYVGIGARRKLRRPANTGGHAGGSDEVAAATNVGNPLVEPILLAFGGVVNCLIDVI